ncbi:MAG: HdeD family acid-resistance protein [Legionella sp.]|jgi:uncharacterized membrane protein HdeD (DUF308 family)
MSRNKVVVESNVIDLNRNWGWILGFGILSLILGCIGLGMAVGLTLVSMYFFSALLFVAGISHIIDVFKHKEWRGVVWHAFIAVLYIAAAGDVLYDPFMASTIITGILAGILIVIGVTRLIMAFTLKNSTGWGWLVLAGLASIILGLLILAQWPVSGLWVIGMFIAIELIVSGWTYIFIAFALKRAQA